MGSACNSTSIAEDIENGCLQTRLVINMMFTKANLSTMKTSMARKPPIRAAIRVQENKQ